MSSIFRRFFYALSYLGNPPWDTGVSPPELLDFLAVHPPGLALDMGCGTGTNLVTLAQNGWQIYGIDFSGFAVKTAIKRLSRLGLNGHVWRGDVCRRLAVDGQFDLILDIGCYHDLSPEGRRGYRENIATYLAAGGSFLIYAHCLSPERSRATGVSELDIDEFSKFLDVITVVQTTDRWERRTSWMTFTKRS
jgi:cyclopropane fatty-acyl-phospholipid synthase-like methyltransferase